MEDLRSPLVLPARAMVEVFKTNVQTAKEAQVIIADLQACFPAHTINFDLEDCDRILRVEGEALDVERLLLTLWSYGLECSVLED